MRTKYSFIGNFMIPRRGGSVDRTEQLSRDGQGVFYMFADSIEDVGGIEKIAGRIMDVYRNATFVGEISESRIKFIKKYEETIGKRQVSLPREVHYDGKRNPRGKFVGRYKLFNGEKLEDEGNFVLIDAPKIFLDLSELFNL